MSSFSFAITSCKSWVSMLIRVSSPAWISLQQNEGNESSDGTMRGMLTCNWLLQFRNNIHVANVRSVKMCTRRLEGIHVHINVLYTYLFGWRSVFVRCNWGRCSSCCSAKTINVLSIGIDQILELLLCRENNHE